MTVPFLDLQAQHRAIREELMAALERVLDRTAFAGGPFTAEFETAFAAFCACEHAVGVGSGTDALWVALIALGVGPGDEVITVPNTFIATAEAITYAGATPVFVDVDERTYNLNPALLEKAITPRTKAVIPVHLYGQMADMDPIMEIARKHGLFVIEDACQAHGAEYKGRRAGSIGDAGAFSFYPGKNLGACGEGGAAVTNNAQLAEKMKMFRDHGQKKKYVHAMIGWNARMDGFQAACLSVKLKRLPQWNEARRAHAKRYDQLLSGLKDIQIPYVPEYSKPVYHLYSLLCPRRDALIEALGKKDISCGMHYPIPVHLQEAYRDLGLKKGSFPVAEKCAEQQLSLPMFAELPDAQIDEVAAAIREFVEP